MTRTGQDARGCWRISASPSSRSIRRTPQALGLGARISRASQRARAGGAARAWSPSASGAARFSRRCTGPTITPPPAASTRWSAAPSIPISGQPELKITPVASSLCRRVARFRVDSSGAARPGADYFAVAPRQRRLAGGMAGVVAPGDWEVRARAARPRRAGMARLSRRRGRPRRFVAVREGRLAAALFVAPSRSRPRGPGSPIASARKSPRPSVCACSRPPRREPRPRADRLRLLRGRPQPDRGGERRPGAGASPRSERAEGGHELRLLPRRNRPHRRRRQAPGELKNGRQDLYPFLTPTRRIPSRTLTRRRP